MRARISAIVGAALILVALASAMLEAFHLTELIEKLIPNWMDQLITPRVDLVIFLVGFLIIGLAWIDYRHESGKRNPELPLSPSSFERMANTGSSGSVHMSNDQTVTAGKNSPIIIDSPVSADTFGPITDSQVAVGSNISQSVAVHHHYAEKGIPQKLTPTEPTPSQIIKAVDSVKPYDKHREKEKFIGLEVTWRVKLGNLSPTTIYVGEDGKESFTSTKNGAWLVTCGFKPSPDSEKMIVQFHLSEVPLELKIANRYASFLVQGRIQEVFTDSIVLRANPKLLGFENSS